MSSTHLTRRRFTKAAATAAASLPLWACQAQPPAYPLSRRIELYNTHTHESINLVFADENGYRPAALHKLEYFLRDYRIKETHPIDPELYMQLTDLAHAAQCAASFEVISGYRSPLTNAKLRQGGHAVAEHSLHMEGRAIDVRLKGFDTAKLRDLALLAGRGGVGFYPKDDFVHIDTGRVRSWKD
jgi:uncharacterized protein YcbK (DUF882 family)